MCHQALDEDWILLAKVIYFRREDDSKIHISSGEMENRYFLCGVDDVTRTLRTHALISDFRQPRYEDYCSGYLHNKKYKHGGTISTLRIVTCASKKIATGPYTR